MEKKLSGFIKGREIDVGDVKVRAETPERYSSSIIIESLDGKPISDSQTLVVAVLSTIKNTNAEWNEGRNSTGQNWGIAPALALFVDFTITIPWTEGTINVSSLTSNGDENGFVKIQQTNNGFSFSSDKENPTLWYLIKRTIENDPSETNQETDPSETNQENDPSENNSGDGIGTTNIIIICVVVVVVVIALVIGILCFIKKRNSEMKDSDLQPENI